MSSIYSPVFLKNYLVIEQQNKLFILLIYVFEVLLLKNILIKNIMLSRR